MKMHITQKQTQKLALAPAIQQSIKVLILPITELTMTIQQELQNNPLLEIDEDRQLLTEEQIDKDLTDKLSTLQDSTDYSRHQYNRDDEIIEEPPLVKETTLEEYLLKQLYLETSDPLEYKIGELIIGSLDEDGYLTISTKDIAKQLNIPNNAAIENFLKRIQQFDPKGIAARTLQECLLIQINNHPEYRTDKIAIEIITHYLDALGARKISQIARKVKTTSEKILNAAHTIAQLDPRPARNFRSIKSNIYIKPDIFIMKDADSEYHIYVNETGVPPLRISPIYRKLLKTKKLSKEEKDFIREKIKNALYFMKSIKQRNSTIFSIAQYILDKQKEFLESGTSAIAPMKLKDIADAIDRNESTISRAINNKYIETPQGLFPLKFFFSQTLSKEGNSNVSTRSIKEDLRQLISDEDPLHPLSDNDIVKHFKAKDISIARRTVSKYRTALKILPAHLRRQ